MRRSTWLAVSVVGASLLAWGIQPAQAATLTVVVPAAAETGVASGVDLNAGDTVAITATGTAQTVDWQPPTNPDGLWPDGGSASCIGIAETCLAQTTASALIAKVGNGPWTFVGSGPVTLSGVGAVRLAYNDAIGFFGDNLGSYTAQLDVTRAAPPCASVTVRQPINANGTSVFKAGSTVPVKFGCSVGTLTPTLALTRLTSTTLGTTLEAEVAATATNGSAFRYDASEAQYIYNLSTKGMATGTYRLNILSGGGTISTVQISLR